MMIWWSGLRGWWGREKKLPCEKRLRCLPEHFKNLALGVGHGGGLDVDGECLGGEGDDEDGLIPDHNFVVGVEELGVDESSLAVELGVGGEDGLTVGVTRRDATKKDAPSAALGDVVVVVLRPVVADDGGVGVVADLRAGVEGELVGALDGEEAFVLLDGGATGGGGGELV